MSPSTLARRRHAPRRVAGAGFALIALLATALGGSPAIAGPHGPASTATVPTASVPPAVLGATPAAAPGGKPLFVSRMTARWTELRDSSGAVWSARSSTLGTTARSTTLEGKDIAGTTEDALYAVNAQGVTGYRLPVPVAGTYEVRILAAEDWHTQPGKRVFDITAEGEPALRGIDLVKAVGKGAAYDRRFETLVTDGQLDLSVVATADRSLISAIEVTLVDTGGPIVLTPQAGAELFAARSTAQWANVTDSAGRVWGPRTNFVAPTSRASTTLLAEPAGGNRTLYETLTAIDAYRAKVPLVGRYQVRILLTENYFKTAGKRVFDVRAEGGVGAVEVDPVVDAGYRLAGERRFSVAVTDGQLDLDFVNTVDRAQVAAIEVVYAGPIPTTPTTPDGSDPDPGDDTPKLTFASRMTASSSPIVDTAGNTWAARGITFGTTNISSGLVGQDIAGTDDDELYQRNGWGIKGYLVPVPAAGTYQVRLLMAEDFFTAAGARVFDAVAEGSTKVAGIDIAKAVGRKHAYDVRFDVEVTDGELNLSFVPVVNNALISAIEVTSTTVGAPETGLSGRAVTFSPSSFYTQDVSKAPVAQDSAQIVANLAGQVAGVHHGVAGVNAYRYNVAFYPVPADQPTVRVGFSDCQGKGYTPHDLFDGRAQFVDVPVPDDAVPATGSDAQMTIYDKAADRLWEFWQMRRTPTGGWEACWGGRIDDVSTSQGVFEAPFGAAATGLAMSGGMISIGEAKRGSIDHAMYLGVIDARSDTQSWPANRNDGNVEAAGIVTQGQRLRLDPSIDVSTLGLTPFGQMVARAAQKHGFIVSDRAGAVSVITEAGRAEEARTGHNPWDVLLNGPDYAALANFPWDRLEALPVDYGRPADS